MGFLTVYLHVLAAESLARISLFSAFQTKCFGLFQVRAEIDAQKKIDSGSSGSVNICVFHFLACVSLYFVLILYISSFFVIFGF